MRRKDAGGAVRWWWGVTGTDSRQPSSPSSPTLPSSLLFSPLRHASNCKGDTCKCFNKGQMQADVLLSSCLHHLCLFSHHLDITHTAPQLMHFSCCCWPIGMLYVPIPLPLPDFRSMCKHHLDPHVVSWSGNNISKLEHYFYLILFAL